MKRLSLLLVMLLLAALALVACQPTGGTNAPVEEAPVEEAPVDEAAPTDEAPPAEEDMGAMECTDAIGCVEIAAGDPIQIASALVISGPNADLGLDSQHGVEIALSRRGDVLGHSVELIAEDDGCNAEGGQTAGNKIVANPQIVGAIATSCSGAGVPMAQIISDAGYVMISPSNTSPALTDPAQAFKPGYLRTAHNDLIQGAAMADYAYDVLGVTKAAAIHDGDPYTEGLAKAFSDAFEAKGGEMVAFEAEAADATNVEPLLTTVAAAGPEFLYYPVFIPLGSLITNTAKNISGLEDVYLAAADGVQSPSFLENTVDTSEGMFVSGPDLAFSNTFYQDEFLPMYMEMFGTEPTAPFHAHAYDATMMLLNAIETVAQQDADGNLLIGRQALRDALYATSGYEGITGTLTCDEFGDCADPKISVSEVQGGEFVRVWP
ncbi:MAG: branched-chain amino acid ABC transporter substrate-binding protein [Anaerolineae bacterium]|uniref:branched-chain amino acid ABC transporter substrate-binding protein n=1 Tax=Promineifilum sp. TaxID=2664178 RepID=UPI001D4F11FB|nr:branched-chain amino acid ABC transporter substrate-binding protein [Anaerolineales bacterium]MCB8935565.1 branched-chain amino acid ABC transporter substrate-binding protein [Promineifilum sp.]MCO5180638.1 branched-chain amino acid ABC transporter substrate-binding protein [Promineifilum sp.]MCW5847635.1 branched-chain amino acid ABC transporter substrate-binding protein [Anaerolineae bacterium]